MVNISKISHAVYRDVYTLWLRLVCEIELYLAETTFYNPVPHFLQLTVLATNNFEQGFQDQDIDMRRMVNEFEKLSNGLILITIRDVMNHAGLNITMLPTIDVMNHAGLNITMLPTIDNLE